MNQEETESFPPPPPPTQERAEEKPKTLGEPNGSEADDREASSNPE